MSSPNTFWFHCGRCGSLFESEAGDLDDRLCPKCGFDPSTGIFDAEAEPAAVPEAQAAEGLPAERRGKRSGKRRKNRFFMVKLIAGWLLVLAVIIFGARYLWHDETSVANQGTDEEIRPAANAEEDAAFLQENLNKCLEIFSGFLAAGSPEERNQFVLKPIATASRMARFHSLNPITTIDPATIKLASHAVLHLPEGRAIETCWTSEDGKSLDAVFREENGEWRLDWDHYARYSDYPWSLYLAGSGEAEGEFRLLARERLAEDNKNADHISLVLYAPRFGQPLETGFQSPEFLVSRKTRAGRLLDAAFKLTRDGGQAFNSKLPNPNPEGLLRLRVKVKRTEVNNDRKFEIADLVACHWFSVEAPGVEPAPEAPAPEAIQR